MIRFLTLILGVAPACALPAERATAITVEVQGEDQGVLPFRAGGPFAVKVTATNATQLGRSSHAAVDLVTPMVVTGAVATATVVLTDQDDGTLAGTAALAWPPGHPVMVRAQVADAISYQLVPFEPLALTFSPQAFTTTGADIAQAYCIDSPSTDGSIAVHLEGAVLQDTKAPDGTAMLAPGACSGASLDLANPSSHARIAVIAKKPAFSVVASLTNTDIVARYDAIVPAFGPLTLSPSAATLTPPKLSIVDVDVNVKLGAANAAGIALTFQSVPDVMVVPATATTDAAGNARTSFQMPSSGQVRILVGASNQTAEITFQ